MHACMTHPSTAGTCWLLSDLLLQELRHLCLVNICWGPLISSSSRDALSAAANRLWEGCSQLTHLQAEQ